MGNKSNFVLNLNDLFIFEKSIQALEDAKAFIHSVEQSGKKIYTLYIDDCVITTTNKDKYEGFYSKI